MADSEEVGSLESPKKRPRLENEAASDIFTCGVGRETSHLPTSGEISSLLAPPDQLFEGKDSLNFDPDSGAGFERELPSGGVHRDERVPSHFDNDFLPEQNDASEHNYCLPCPAPSRSPTTSDTNASLPHETVSDVENEDDHSSGSEDGSLDSQDDGDLDLGLGECDLDQPMGPMGWLQQQMMSGVHPRSILDRLLPSVSTSLPEDLNEFEVWSIIADYFQMLREPPRRKKLPAFNTFDDALSLLRSSKRIMVLTGAGVSVSCGIPDFRSRDGVYARLAVDFPDLPDPQAIFDIHYFRRNPRPFFKFAKEIYPGEFRPSTCHKFISLLERHGKLLRNFSQNIDTLEQVAGITKVLQCHGSFATAHCTNCNYQVDAEAIRADIYNQEVPLCPHCPPDPDILAVMKPDIVFFGEGLPKDFYHCLDEDKEKADLLIVIGSSLKVQPVATIPNTLPGTIPQILINREPLNHMTFDIELLGDGDVIVNEICRRLGKGWDHICRGEALTETMDMPRIPTATGSDASNSDAPSTPERITAGLDVADSTSWVRLPGPDPSETEGPPADGTNVPSDASNSTPTKIETRTSPDAEPSTDEAAVSAESTRILQHKAEVAPGTEEPLGEAILDEVMSEAARMDEVTSEAARMDEVTSEAARMNEVTSEAAKKDKVMSEAARVDRVTSQAARIDGVTSEAARMDGVMSDAARMDGVTSEAARKNEVMSEAARVDGVMSEVARKNEVTSQAAGMAGVTSEAARMNGVMSQAAGMDGVTSEAARMNGVTSQAAGMDGVTSEAARIDKVTSEAARMDGVTSETARMDGVTSETARRDEIPSSDSSTHDRLTPIPQSPHSPPGRNAARHQQIGTGLNGHEPNGTQNSIVSSTYDVPPAGPHPSASPTPPSDDVFSPVKKEAPSLFGEANCSTAVSGNDGPNVDSKNGTAVEEDRSKTDVGTVLKAADEVNTNEAKPKRKRRNSIALYLNSSSYLFVPPNRYIFHGAEVFPPSRPESPLLAKADNDDDDDDEANHDDDREAERRHDLSGMPRPPSDDQPPLQQQQQKEQPSTNDALMAEAFLQQPPVPTVHDELDHLNPTVQETAVAMQQPPVPTVHDELDHLNPTVQETAVAMQQPPVPTVDDELDHLNPTVQETAVAMQQPSVPTVHDELDHLNPTLQETAAAMQQPPIPTMHDELVHLNPTVQETAAAMQQPPVPTVHDELDHLNPTVQETAVAMQQPPVPTVHDELDHLNPTMQETGVAMQQPPVPTVHDELDYLHPTTHDRPDDLSHAVHLGQGSPGTGSTGSHCTVDTKHSPTVL